MLEVFLRSRLQQLGAIALLLCLGCTSAWAQAAVPFEPVSQGQVKVLQSLVLNTSALASLADVQASNSTAPDKWLRFENDSTYAMNSNTALWVKMQLSVAAPLAANGWRIKVPKPFIDRIEVYTAAPNGIWQVQAAGDHIAGQDWPVRSLQPQFMLPSMPPGEHSVWIKVNNVVPANFEIQLQSDKQASASNLDDYVLSALPIVLILCMGFISVCLAVAFHQSNYLVYCVYTVFTAAAVAGYTGFGQLLLWPAATHWPDISIHVLILLAHLALGVFCYATFEPQRLFPQIKWLMVATFCCTFICIVVLLLPSTIEAYTVANFAGMAVNWAIIFSIIFLRLQLGELSAKLWGLAYIPLAATLLVASLDNFGLLSRAGLGFYWPLYCLVFEVPLLLLALMLRAKTQHALAVGQQVRVQLDPLTGFILPRAYTPAATAMWEQATSLDNDLAVVYVQVRPPADLPMALGLKMPAEESDRLVRILRTVFRAHDMYAQVSRNVYAVWMPKTSMDDTLKVRLARVVAQMHMLSHESKNQQPLRVRIVACTSASLALPWQQAHQAMLDKLNSDTGWSKRSIRYVSSRRHSPDSQSSVSDFWDKALDISMAKDAAA